VGLGIAAKKGPQVHQLVLRAFVTHHHIHAQDRTRTLLFPLKLIASAILEDVIRQDVVQALPALLAGVLRMVLPAHHAPLGIALKLGQRIQHAGVGFALKLGQRVRIVGLGIAVKKGPRVRHLVLRAFVTHRHQHAQDRTRTLLLSVPIASAILDTVIRQHVVQALPALVAGVVRMVLTAQHASVGVALNVGQIIQFAGLGFALKMMQRVRLVMVGLAAK